MRGRRPLGDLRVGVGAVALVEPGDAAGQQPPVFGQPGPVALGRHGEAHRTQPPLTSQTNSRPSATVTWLRVSHTRSGSRCVR